MKPAFPFRQNLLPLAILFISITQPGFYANAQNTSYSANSIPIGGASSTAFGFEALKVNTGTNNTATGSRSLFSNTSGVSNTSTGYEALYSNLDGSNNTANGYQALYSNNGNSNLANGGRALYSNISGYGNVANGSDALFANTNGSGNTANGNQAMADNISGEYNTANGFQALVHNTYGNNNIANGFRSLFANTTGSYNIAFGENAGFNNSGYNNIYLGTRTGYYETGDNKLYIGNDSNKTIMYGNLSTGQLLFGNQQPTGYTFIGTHTLNVLGGIIADSVRVALSGNWSDYVFDEEYQLRTTEELACFIKTYKHLPNMPSAAEVAANGINLVDMNAKLLEKIEELTLYMLEQRKQMQIQQDMIDKHEKNYTVQLTQMKEQIKVLNNLVKGRSDR
jgi:hypothetical protein